MKELPNDTFHKSDGQKYGHDGQGGGQHGKSNFLSANHGSVIGLFTHLHMSNDIFSNDNGVVNQEPDTQWQGHQRDHVDSETKHAHEPEGADQRNGQRQSCDDRWAPRV